jgi:hypothetical protein
MLLYPAIGEWDPSASLLCEFSGKSPAFPQLRSTSLVHQATDHRK